MSTKSANGTGLTWLDEILTKAEEERDRLQARRDALAAQLSALDSELRQANRVLRVIQGPSPSKPKPNTKVYKGSRFSAARLARLAQAIQDMDSPTFTVLEIHDVMGQGSSSHPQTYGMFRVLRQWEILGKAGKDPVTKRQFWRVMDYDKLSRVANESDNS